MIFGDNGHTISTGKKQCCFVFDNGNAIESLGYKFGGSLFCVCAKFFIHFQARNIEFMTVINMFTIPSYFRLHGKRRRYFRRLFILTRLNKMLQVVESTLH